jgi:hypothetical protein
MLRVAKICTEVSVIYCFYNKNYRGAIGKKT